jgi:hypothetical protein
MTFRDRFAQGWHCRKCRRYRGGALTLCLLAACAWLLL